MSPIFRSLIPILTFLFLACAPESVPDRDDGRRGSIGKADSHAGSCEESDSCGGKSDGTCWCDSLCMHYGDCCADTAEYCDIDECNAVENTGCPEGETCMAVGDANDCQVPDLASCGPQDAEGFGLCEAVVGWKWTGVDCIALSGCSCTGPDCGELYASPDECELAQAHCYPTGDCPDWNDPAVEYASFDIDTCAVIRFTCEEGQEGFSSPECGCGCAPPPPAMCGGFAGIPCEGENEYCDYGSHCGSGDQSGVCRIKPDLCLGVYEPVCGCDGVTYSNACRAASEGVSVADLGECAPAPDSCEAHCGGTSEDGSCWCDSLCSYYGDCCDDKVDHCG